MNESGFVLTRRASCGNTGSPFSSELNSRFPTAFFFCASGRCSPSSGCSLGAVDTEAFSSANPGVALEYLRPAALLSILQLEP